MMNLPDKITLPEKLTEEQIEELHSFYTIDVDKVNLTIKKISLDKLKMIELLKKLGYYRFDMPDNSSVYVYISDNRISLIHSEQIIIDAFEDYILRLPDRSLVLENNETVANYTITGRRIQEVLYRNIQVYFGANLGRLRPNIPIVMLKDTKKTKHFFFANTAVVCTPDEPLVVPYSELKGMIWQSNIISRPFEYSPIKGDFERFIEDICGSTEERKKSLMTLLGYLMHDFYEVDLHALLLTDVNSDNEGESAGGTGKGLIGKALGLMLNRMANDSVYVAIPGKTTDFEKDTRYCLADATTQLIHLEDVGHRFKLDQIYNDVTDGATLRRPYQIRPTVRFVKMMISLNKAMRLRGPSDHRRIVVFELANYYSEKLRPSDKFKKRFFESDWSDGDWNSFYSFMCRCQCLYLKHGIIKPEEINYSSRTLAETVNEDFRYWFADQVKQYTVHKERMPFVKEELFLEFSTKYPQYNSQKDRIRFTKWCKSFCELKQIPYTTVRSTKDLFIIYPNTDDFNSARSQKL